MALDFLILYEHTVREYESDLLLKLELERRGYTAEIRQLLDPKHLRLFGKDKPEVLVASCTLEEDVRRQATSVGPHRDDLVFSVGPADLRKYGSQG